MNDEEAEPTPEEKQKYLEELQKFTQDVDEKIKELCSHFGFDFDDVNKPREPFMVCPFNSGHRMPERSVEKHLKQCEWNTLGYTKDCKPLPDSALSEESPSTIKFDMQLQHKVLKDAKEKNPNLNIGDEEKLIPLTSDRLMSDFTVDERRVMYDYVIANTVAPDVGKDINIDNSEKKEEKNTTILELLQQERNLKRRRAKYRGVHTNKKTHTEILREVVEQQMEMYKEYISEKYGFPISEDQKSSYSGCNEYKADAKYDENSKFSRHKNYESSNENCSKSDGNKFESKDFHQKHNSKHFKYHCDKDYKSHKSSHKDDSSKNSSKDRSSQYSEKNFNRQESSDWRQNQKYDFEDRKWNRREDNYKSEDKHSNSRSRQKSRSRSKERKHDDSRKRNRSDEKKSTEKSKESRSKERRKDEKESDFSSERKSHKKHKKQHKKKRDRSNDSHDTASRKHSKKEHKRRSRSLS